MCGENIFWRNHIALDTFLSQALASAMRATIARRRLPAVVQALKVWREINGLTQWQAAEAMNVRGVPVLLGTMRKWECGDRHPGTMATGRLERFFEQWPRVSMERPPGRWKNAVSAEKAAAIRLLREQGELLRVIWGKIPYF